MDCCDLLAWTLVYCAIITTVVILVAFNYAFKGKFGNKEVSAKPPTPKTAPPNKGVLRFGSLPAKRKKDKVNKKNKKKKN